MFDQSKLVILKGTVKSFSYVNPHSWISIEGAPAKSKAAPLRWDIEAVAPGALARIGILGDTLKPGDKVTAAIRPLRDGRHAGSLVFITAPDGKSYGAKPSELGVDADGAPLPGGAPAAAPAAG
jgi:hypothetical protein